MLLVGLTGGIGAGKSAVAARLAELGAVIIDSDQLARAVVAPGTDGLAEVVARFGAGVLAPGGELDRSALARVVFGDVSKRRALEQIVHPRVRARAAELAAAAPSDAVVVNDVPLLVESGLAESFDLVVVVEAPVSVRVARLTRDRGLDEAQARSRIDAQASDDQRRAIADVLILNDGSLAELREAVDAAWRAHIEPARRARSGH